jgi:hypothetical protein
MFIDLSSLTIDIYEIFSKYEVSTSVVVLLIQMLPQIAYERWLTMTILEHLDEIHDKMYPCSAPRIGGKDYVLLDCIDVYIFTLLPAA